MTRLGQAEYAEAMRRFYELPVEDQLRALAAMRDFLGAAGPSEAPVERELRERREALAALRKVAEHLELGQGKAPTAAQFDAVSPELRLEWTSARVRAAWGTWRFALDAFRGGRVPMTPTQRAHRQKQIGRRRSHEAPLESVRRWLGTNPPLTRIVDYNDWARQENSQRDPDAPPFPLTQTIRNQLNRNWADVLRVARGEIALDDVPVQSRQTRGEWSRGPHELISIQGVGRILGLTVHGASARSHREGFPVPVATFAGHRLWLREDVLAYSRGEAFPERAPNELQPLYMSAPEVAAEIGVALSTLAERKFDGPPQAGRAGARKFFLRAEVEEWLRDHPRPGRESLS